MDRPENSAGSQSERDQLRSPDALGIKELGEVFSELRTTEEEILIAIESVLLEPIPDPGDDEAMREFRERMAALEAFAKERLVRSTMILDVQERIRAKVAENKQN